MDRHDDVYAYYELARMHTLLEYSPRVIRARSTLVRARSMHTLTSMHTSYA